MPKSKRNKLVSLTKSQKKGKEHKDELIQKVRSEVAKCNSVYVFEVQGVRSTALRDVQLDWLSTGKLFLGKRSLMRYALGLSKADELEPGISGLSKYLFGDSGLFITSLAQEDVLEYFEAFTRKAFARAGQSATRTVELPAGPIKNAEGVVFPHVMEPQLRKLGLSSRLDKGIPTIDTAHVVCKEGDTLTAEQAHLLKHLMIQMSSFKLTMLARWSRDESKVVELAQPSFKPQAAKVNKVVTGLRPIKKAKKTKAKSVESDAMSDEMYEDEVAAEDSDDDDNETDDEEMDSSD